jgi:hypothetical protein
MITPITQNMGTLLILFTYKWFYLQQYINKHICNVTFINVISKVILSKVCISIVVVSGERCWLWQLY